MVGVTGSHHVLGIEDQLDELGPTEHLILLASMTGQRGKSRHEEVETWGGHHVDCQVVEVGTELAKGAEAGSDITLSGGWKEVLQVPVGWRVQLEGAEAEIVKGLTVNAVDLISVFQQLMDREGGGVGLNHSVGHWLEGTSLKVFMMLASSVSWPLPQLLPAPD